MSIGFVMNYQSYTFARDADLVSWLYDKVNSKSILKSEAIILYVLGSGKYGRRFSDIQRFLCEMNGIDFDVRELVYIVEKNGIQSDFRAYSPEATLIINGHLFIKYYSGLGREGKIVGQKLGRRINRGSDRDWET